MGKQIISCKGLKIKDYFIPPFELKENELLGIMTGNNWDSRMLEQKLIDFFSKDEHYSEPKFKLHYIDHFREKKWLGLERFFPTKVGSFLKKKANQASPLSKSIYEVDYITPSTRIHSLPGNPRRLLTISAFASKSKYLIFDTVTQDREGVENTLKFVIEHVIKKGGAAVWFDHFGESKELELCTKHITILKNGNEIEPEKIQFDIKLP